MNDIRESLDAVLFRRSHAADNEGLTDRSVGTNRFKHRDNVIVYSEGYEPLMTARGWRWTKCGLSSEEGQSARTNTRCANNRRSNRTLKLEMRNGWFDRRWRVCVVELGSSRL